MRWRGLRSAGRAWAAPLGLALLLWAALAWPLPRYACRGIPYTFHRGDQPPTRWMVPGDHLQLLYRFALVEDMLRGGTPWFANLYEFNRGDDAARVAPGPFYAPFSVAFGLLAWLGSWAAAWNALSFLALGLTLVFTAGLLRRFGIPALAALAGAALAMAHPYRIENWMGGAPAGLAMMWIPACLWGLDAAIRDGRRAGGAAAGLALWGMAWTDPQSFFLLALATPLWALWRFAVGGRAPGALRTRLVRAVRGLWPAVPCALPGLWIVTTLTPRLAESAHMAGGRDLREVLAYSPSPRLFFDPAPAQPVQIYLGYAWLVLVAAGVVAWALAARRNPAAARRGAAVGLVLALGLGAALVLTLGLRGPFGGRALLAVRRVLPPFRMIRHPAKIFVLAPTLMALAAGLALGRLSGDGRRRSAWVAALWLALMTVEYGVRARPGICLLDPDPQAAYAAVRADTLEGEPPRALVLPLWPGDSHWTSLYTYHAMRHRVRLLNGYSPVVDAAYVEEVFLAYRGLTAGEVRDEELDRLLEKGFRHLLLHEDAFPERVSPYPAGFTLARLLAHPRLELRAADRGVWAFRIRETPDPAPRPTVAWAGTPGFPSRGFHALHLRGEEAPLRVEDPGTERGWHVVLTPRDPPLAVPRFSAWAAPGQQLRLRLRGEGRLRIEAVAEGAPDWADAAEVEVRSEDWTWVAAPLGAPARYDTLRLRLAAVEGEVRIDSGWVVAGDWTPPPPGGAIALPAPVFFRAGYTDPERGLVVLRPGHMPADRIFYGPRLPLEPGDYEVELLFDSPAPAGAVLGTWRCDRPASVPADAREGIPVVAGRPALLPVRVPDHRPAEFGFVFTGDAEVELRGVRLRRLEADGEDRP